MGFNEDDRYIDTCIASYLLVHKFLV